MLPGQTGAMELDEIRAEAARLSPWAHLATVGADGKPDVAPIHPAWEGDTLWIFTFTESVKVKNLGANPDVAMHWQVDESGDGVAVWGRARVHTDEATKRRLWTGVFDYDLDAFAPDGPASDGVCFIEITPERALALKAYGTGGRDTWRRR
jgi:general stress protein 26